MLNHINLLMEKTKLIENDYKENIRGLEDKNRELENKNKQL